MALARVSFILRCSREDAANIRNQAVTEHRSVGGYLLRILDRSVWIDEKFTAGLSKSLLVTTPFHLRPIPETPKTTIHLRCFGHELDRIRQAALRRQMSINEFVLFSLHRYWRAVEKVRDGTPLVPPALP